jgi:prepilin-type N-terminal cleavage/methylation domain-containing protein
MVKLLRRRSGFTMVEVLVSITVLAVGTLVLGGLLVKASRSAEAASSMSFQTAAMAAELARLDALPFTALAAGTTCDTTAGPPLPRIRCSTITTVSANRKTIKVKVTATENPLVQADSVMFERSVTVGVNPLNTPLFTP